MTWPPLEGGSGPPGPTGPGASLCHLRAVRRGCGLGQVLGARFPQEGEGPPGLRDREVRERAGLSRRAVTLEQRLSALTWGKNFPVEKADVFGVR